MVERAGAPRAPASTARREPRAFLGARVEYRPMMPVSDPQSRVFFGAVIFFVGLGCALVPYAGNGRHWLFGLAGIGVAMIASGVNHQRHDNAIRRELARADAEWDELRAKAAELRSDTVALVRLMQARGYRNYFVRRWLIDRLLLDLRGQPRR